MRLDKFLVSTGKLSRSEAGRAARGGRIFVNDVVEKRADRPIDPENDCITLDGVPLVYRQFTYILLNKPDGYVSATEDSHDPTVLSLLPQDLQRIGLFPCGRLDKHTLGLMLLTNDGKLGHRLLSPRHHVEKQYAYTCRDALCAAHCRAMEQGIVLDDGYRTKPAHILPKDDYHGTIILTEGKYHQIKRMAGALSNRITALERIAFGPLTLDPTLRRGECRPLTDDEIDRLRRAAEMTAAT